MSSDKVTELANTLADKTSQAITMLEQVSPRILESGILALTISVSIPMIVFFIVTMGCLGFSRYSYLRSCYWIEQRTYVCSESREWGGSSIIFLVLGLGSLVGFLVNAACMILIFVNPLAYIIWWKIL